MNTKNSGGLRPPWKKGQSGNPKGHQKGVRHWSTVLHERFVNGTINQEQLADVLIKKAKNGDLKAFSMIMDKMDGKSNSLIETYSLTFVDLLRQGAERRQKALSIIPT